MVRGRTALEFVATMQRNRAGSQIKILDALESCVLHQSFQFFLRGMYTNGFSEIAIALLIFGNELTHCRQYLE